ncbi:MAG: type II toxin-antitoxin system Phd/YefM family antitoxin [Mycobacterium sp.]
MRASWASAVRYLARVAAGEVIEITDRGQPIARLVPIPPDPRQGLIDSGEITPASGVRDFTPLPDSAPASASAVLERLRAEER